MVRVTRLLLLLLVLALPASIFGLDLTIGSEVISYSGTDIYDYSGYNYQSYITFDNEYVPAGEIGIWGHSLDPAFMTVPDDFTVIRATLQITGWAPNGVGDGIVTVQQDYRWTGPTGWTCLTDYSDKFFELTDIDDHFWNSSPLYVEIAQPAAVGVTLTSSRLLVEYSPADPGTAIPEPTTVVLFGAGLLGAGIYLRKKVFA
ncbi:MAG: PEP-CTERM sorting domain-containing protein [Candidatus Zixiibacteriota bacterium]